MHRLSALTSLGMALFLSSVGASGAADCSLKEIVSLPMMQRDDSRVVVQLMLNEKPTDFIVDTGGAYTMLYSRVADEMHLGRLPIDPNIEIYDLEGNLSRRFVKVPKFSIGPINADNIAMVVANGNSDEPEIAGILGPDILGRFDVEIDFQSRRVNLISPDHCEGHVVYWSRNYTDVEFSSSDGHLVIPMVLDGKTVKAALDTGSPLTMMSESALTAKFNLKENSPGMEMIPGASSDSFVQRRYRFESLSFNGLIVTNPVIYIFPDAAAASFNARHLAKEDFDAEYAPRLLTQDVLLGMNVIQKLHIYISYKEHKLYLTNADIP